MSQKQSKTGLIVTIIVLAITVIAVMTVSFLMRTNKTPATETKDTSSQVTETAKPSTDTKTEDTDEEPAAATVDPTTLSSIAVEPLGVTVFYTKGTPGFDFAVKRTADRTLYAEFTSPELIGTKCTDDEGLFASIIKNPTSDENQTTISQTTKVGSDTYGLSLASNGCTRNESLLKEYQDGFKAGFSSLKTI